MAKVAKIMIVFWIFNVIYIESFSAPFENPPQTSHPGKKKIKIGLSVWTGYPENIRGFKAALKAGGYIEGQNVEYLYQKSDGDKSLQRKILQEFNQTGIDLVYSLTTPGTVLAKEMIDPKTPIVFSIVTYPADSGLIDSLEYSANNLVGTSNYVPIRYHVDLLQRFLPQASRFAIFHRTGEPNSKIQAIELRRAITARGKQVVIRHAVDLPQLQEMAENLVGKVDAFITTADTLMQSGGEQLLINISLNQKIPILSSNKKGIELGASFGAVTDFYTLGQLSGEKAVQILTHGVKPYQLETELQEPPIYLANQKSLSILGVNVPEELVDTIQWAK